MKAEIQQLIEEARDCIQLFRDRMLEFSDIDALEWKANAAERAMRESENQTNET